MANCAEDNVTDHTVYTGSEIILHEFFHPSIGLALRSLRAAWDEGHFVYKYLLSSSTDFQLEVVDFERYLSTLGYFTGNGLV